LGADLVILRSVLAFLAGAAAIVVLSIATDAALQALHLTPPQSDPGAFTPPMLLAATAYRSLYAVIGSAIAARLAPKAPKAPMALALALGAIGVVLNIAGAWVNWSYGNHWYPIALVVTALPCAWMGGKLGR
jgi:hypothetical protein